MKLMEYWYTSSEYDLRTIECHFLCLPMKTKKTIKIILVDEMCPHQKQSKIDNAKNLKMR